MNERQLADRIGNIDDRLVEEARYRRRKGGGGFRRLLAAAAVLALMAASFTAGALAFSREVPQETVDVPGASLTLVLPDSWRGLYRVETDEDGLGCEVYVKPIYEQEGEWAGAGLLFGARKEYDRPLTREEIDELTPASNWHFFSTPDATYMITYPGDVQWDPNNLEQEQMYRQMQDAFSQIRFLVDGVPAYEGHD